MQISDRVENSICLFRMSRVVTFNQHSSLKQTFNYEFVTQLISMYIHLSIFLQYLIKIMGFWGFGVLGFWGKDPEGAIKKAREWTIQYANQ